MVGAKHAHDREPREATMVHFIKGDSDNGKDMGCDASCGVAQIVTAAQVTMARAVWVAVQIIKIGGFELSN
ncbi:unnamed protein product [Cuscuta campestris]|uniref:Uncharacterized protein n=1 Tax=Cuscuta campestris TaxID=132261 RepID=A0A484KX47_9ASTE|nr:unnamed protein product [Cuscuta campestris]